MASPVQPVQGIERILTCSICLDILESPKTLPCGHSYCEDCLPQIKIIKQNEEEGVSCPQCRNFSRKGEFIKIYVLQEFLDFHSFLKKSKSKYCHLCDESEETDAVVVCVNCKVNMCVDCQRKHKRTPNSRAHTYRDCGGQPTLDMNFYCDTHPDHVTDLYCIECNTVICLKCKVIDHINHQSETVESGILRLRPVMDRKVDFVVKDIEELNYEDRCLETEIHIVKELVKDMKAKYQTCKDTIMASIEKQFNGIIRNLDRQEKASLNMIEEAREKNKTQRVVRQNIVDICKTTLSNAKGCSLLKGLTEGLMEQISEQERKPVVHTEIKLKRPVFEQNPDIGDEYRFLGDPSYEEESKVFTPWTVRSLRMNINEAMSKVGECVHTEDLEGDPYRLAVVDGHIWIPSNMSNKGEYEIFDPISNKTAIQRSCDTLQSVRSFCQTSQNEVIAACGNGLYSLNTQGQVEYKLSDGDFSDVCTNGEKVVAVEGDKCQVQVYTLNNKKWCEESNFIVKDRYTRLKILYVVNKILYICYNWTHKIYKYSVQGEYLEEYGTAGGSEVGECIGPIVSGTDCRGCLFVCDECNNRVQVRSPQGECSQYTLRGVERPLDVLVVRDRMYVLWGLVKNRKLSVYNSD